MADIKVDKVKYLLFLNTVKDLINNIDTDMLSEKSLNEREYILKYINREQDIIVLMEQRKIYYDFYIKNKDIDKISSNEIYKKYLDVKAQIEKLREEEING